MGRRRSPASAVKPASGPEGTSASAAGEALASAADWAGADWAGADWAGADWAGADWAGAGLGLATRRWGSEDGWVRTGGAGAGGGLASASDCGKADGGLASDG